MKILIVEDHEILARNLKDFFALKNIEVDICSNGDEGLYQAITHSYDLLILDINLPGTNGDEICKQLREKGKDIPILMLTSRSSKSDMISGLDIGADDYMGKPFDYDELFARVNSLARRNLQNKSTTQIFFKNFVLDLEKKSLTQEGSEIKLSHLEYDLLKYFVQNIGKILSREKIYEKVWGGYDEFKMGKTVDVYIGYLRKKLGKETIQTKKGFGYIIEK
ncbi:MAG: response regulator transcription factor [Candidatus Gracilibacteria bacterium]|nr:response regulator transcription factor [Candidatus Gracilibacteria bacterium]